MSATVLIAILILIPFLSLAHAAGTHESQGICPGTFKPHTAPPGPYHNHLIKRYRQRMVKSLEEHLTRLEATVEHSEWFRSLDATWPRHLQLPTFSVDLSMRQIHEDLQTYIYMGYFIRDHAHQSDSSINHELYGSFRGLVSSLTRTLCSLETFIHMSTAIGAHPDYAYMSKEAQNSRLQPLQDIINSHNRLIVDKEVFDNGVQYLWRLQQHQTKDGF